MSDLVIDESRRDQDESTGIYVRAKNSEGHWEAIDMACLTRESLLEWLHSRGQCNIWAENVIGVVLGHGPLHAEDKVP